MLQAKLARFTALRGEDWLALTTFDANGQPIVMPLRFAKDGDRLFVLAPADAAQRIHENAQVEVALCTERGETLGESIEAMAVVLPPDKAATARHALAGKFGLLPRLSAFRMTLRLAPGSYLEITPM
jgi:PPOX class probable F420-dependent enzyme